jgi:NADH-quinone oxidoreductase subunit K
MSQGRLPPELDRAPDSSQPTSAPAKTYLVSPAMPDPFTIDILRNYLQIGAVLLCLGVLGFLSRRNLIVMFLSTEMMLQGTALSLVAFGRYHGNWTGQAFTIVILTVAACEASIALALIVILYNRRSSLDVTLWQDIREEGAPPAASVAEEEIQAEPLEPVRGPESYPILTPAGVEPDHPVQPWLERRE